MLPGEIECDQDHEEKEPVTQNTNNNASPSLAHSRLFSLRQEAVLFQLFNACLSESQEETLHATTLYRSRQLHAMEQLLGHVTNIDRPNTFV